ncbi:hypothetical protein BK816_08680 [Boudabousia tangfeifanii]|uniref:Major facilitator superfamily (MFS) profile domain-containing protein n=1 Tax=Boudabousia tangfeifanii TaxID=1912795 RepID=A0A1D9MM07_9ACTO|nr:hypothetical protein BK816_08680 [Boudabousia tangfeifanii]
MYRIPGTFMFSLAGFVARFPMSFVGLATVLLLTQTHESYTAAGLVNAAAIIGFASFAPFLARLVEQFGQSTIMRPSIVISVLSNLALIYFALHVAPVWLLAIFAAVGGAASGSIGAMVRSRWSHTLHDPEQLQTAFALESALDEVVFIFGPIIATTVSVHLFPAAGLLLVTIFSLFGGMWFFSLKSTQPKPTGRSKGGSNGTSPMRAPALWAIGAAFIGSGTLFGALDVAIVEFTRLLGHPGSAGLQLGIMAAGSLLGALVYGARKWSWPLWKLYVTGMALLSLGTTMFIFASTQVVMGILMFITGIVVAPTITNAYSLVERIVPKTRLTEGLTWMNTFMNLGVALGTSLGGMLIDRYGYRGGLALAALASWAMFWVALSTSSLIRNAVNKGAAKATLRGTLKARLGRRRNKSSWTTDQQHVTPSGDVKWALTPSELEEEAGVVIPGEDVRRVPTGRMEQPENNG